MRHGRYTMKQILQRRPDATVYLGYDHVLEQKIVIREYAAEIWREEKEKEAALLFRLLDLPALEAVRDYFYEDGRGYTVADYQPGESLDNVCSKRGRFTEKEAAELLLPVIAAVNAMHASGLVHGNISPGRLALTEDNRLILAADCRRRVEASDREGAPEQYEEEGMTGPWTDVYGLCTVWYRMVTGRPVPHALKRKKRERLRRPSFYAALQARTEQALMRGLSLEIQTRYFSLESFLESMGLSNEEEKKTAGAVRRRFGAAWLEAAEQKKSGENRGRTGRRYLWKRLGVAVLVLTGILALGTVGLRLYIRFHQPQYFAWKAERARDAAIRQGDRAYITEENPEYEAMRTFIQEKGIPDLDGAGSSQNEIVYYEIGEADLEECPQFCTTEQKFYLDYETALDAATYYLSPEEPVEQTESVYRGTASLDSGGWIQSEISRTDTFHMGAAGGTLKLTRDLDSGRLMFSSFQSSEARCALFLEQMLPLLAPETYLTGEEAGELLAMAAGGQNKLLYPTANYEIRISQEDSGGTCSVKIRPLRAASGEDGESGQEYAGNYDRGSKRYGEFLKFVQERAVSEETAEPAAEESVDLSGIGAERFTLEDDSVQEWGLPCNQFRLLAKEETLVSGLRERGYTMELISESQENTVEIQRYGAIVTNFHVQRNYQLTEEMGLIVNSDSVNGDILQMAFYKDEESSAEIESAAVIAAELTGSEEGTDAVQLTSRLAEYAENFEKDEDTHFFSAGEILFLCGEFGENSFAIYMLPVQVYDSAPYYWPV